MATFGAQTVLSELESIGRSNLTWPASPATDLGRTVLNVCLNDGQICVACTESDQNCLVYCVVRGFKY